MAAPLTTTIPAALAPGAMGARCYIGTSAWHYEHWRGPFYPADLPAHAWLTFYAREFDAVEVNAQLLPIANARHRARVRAGNRYIRQALDIPASRASRSALVYSAIWRCSPYAPHAVDTRRSSVSGGRVGLTRRHTGMCITTRRGGHDADVNDT